MLRGADAEHSTPVWEGLDRCPDVSITLDLDMLEKMNVRTFRDDSDIDTVHIEASIPPQCISAITANDPADLPAHLKAKIVNPLDFDAIPVIDLDADHESIVSLIGQACEQVGFFQIRNHGVPTETTQGVVERAAQFFALPNEYKQTLAAAQNCGARGYFGKGDENLAGVQAAEDSRADAAQQTLDNKEGFDMGPEHWDSIASPVFGVDTPWPDGLPEHWRQTMAAYHTQMTALALRLLEYIGEALGLPSGFFTQAFEHPVSTLRTLHYYSHTDYVAGEVGAGAHTDYGGLTILLQGTGGLQVLNSVKQQWVHVPPTPGVFTVNLGDLLSRWSNFRYSSTIHRVINISNVDRYSVPFFFNPNIDTTVTPITPHGEQPASKPVRCGDVLEEFYRKAGMIE
eukprot:TRINITY_DN3310_c0_g1_i2.p1 TRINITY_DN3310_c0_g1~~TRINITY_DN3310_c0_g1_i2.p1  ORF type:complete len:399 (-),score=100.38 TRINITY_DN3310_c0_g1_i2:1150-2346(-)